ncbi:MAG: hypothetical protein LBD36_03100 [Holosporales bacterium]|nr:hypothetical protein [Holosporales bacterium]
MNILAMPCFLSLLLAGIPFAGSTTRECPKIPEESVLTINSANEEKVKQKFAELISEDSGVKLVFGDQGHDKFTLPFDRLIFVDPLANKDNPLHGKNHLFIQATVSDFLYFISQHREIKNLLRKKINFIFDDWSIVTYELEYNYGGGLNPEHPLTFEEKIEILHPCLSNLAKIFISTNCFTAEHWRHLTTYYTVQIFLCPDNARSAPFHLLSESAYFSIFPYWIIAPREFAIKQQQQQDTTTPTGTVCDEIKRFYCANGKFGDRFLAIVFPREYDESDDE